MPETLWNRRIDSDRPRMIHNQAGQPCLDLSAPVDKARRE